MPGVTASIHIRELPQRSRRLSAVELSSIYGGCQGVPGNPYAAHPCASDKDCCDGYSCVRENCYRDELLP